MLHPSCNLTSNTDKTHHGPVIALFSVQLQLPCNQHSSLLLIDRYILAIQQIITQGAFAILFLICGGLLNSLRSFATIVIATESD